MNSFSEHFFYLFRDGVDSIVTVILPIIVGFCLVIATGYQLYTKIRPRFPARVNCWFCNQNSDVPFLNFNSWICKYCEQYNGFMQDGGYNRIIPSQCDELLNHPIMATKLQAFKSENNGLCRKCNLNQELKVHQLASFVPINAAQFEEEVDVYRQRLERVYQLCPQCDGVLQKKLRGIKSWLNKQYPEPVKSHVSPLDETNTESWNSILARTFSFVCQLILVLPAIGAGWALTTRIAPLLRLDIPPEAQPLLQLCLDYEEHLKIAVVILLFVCVVCGPRSHVRLTTLSLWIIATCLTFCHQSSYEAFTNFQLESLKLGIDCMSIITLAMSINNNNNNKKVLKISRGKPKLVMEKSPMFEFPDDEITCLPMKQEEKELLCKEKTNIFQENSIKLDPLELQTGLGELSLGPLGIKPASPPIFEPRLYQVPTSKSPESLFSGTPSLLMQESFGGAWRSPQRPIVSPARLELKKLTQSSWVAGGYWQNHLFPSPSPQLSPFANQSTFGPTSCPLSRSSSQSSGFISQGGGTNFSSLPNSRSGSLCDVDRFSVLSEPVHPYYAPTVAPICCYMATPHPSPIFFSPGPPITNVPSPNPTERETVVTKILPPILEKTISENGQRDVAPQRSLLLIVRENLFLATLFFSSLFFNAGFIGFAAFNTFRVH